MERSACLPLSAPHACPDELGLAAKTGTHTSDIGALSAPATSLAKSRSCRHPPHHAAGLVGNLGQGLFLSGDGRSKHLKHPVLHVLTQGINERLWDLGILGRQ